MSSASTSGLVRRRSAVQPVPATRGTAQTSRARTQTDRRSTVDVALVTSLEHFGRKVRDQDAARAAITLLEGRATRLSERLEAAGAAPTQSSSTPAALQRARANHNADRVQLNDARTQLRVKQLQLQKIGAELNALLPSLPACARLPLEIYSVIFETLHVELLAEVDPLLASRLPWILGTVCSWWRSMLRRLPQLWTVVNFPIQAVSKHDQELVLHMQKQLSFVLPRSRTVTLRLSMQHRAHICGQRPQADSYRNCLQRVLDRTVAIVIVESWVSQFTCDQCHSMFTSRAIEFKIKHPLLRSVAFIRSRYVEHARYQPQRYFPKLVCARLRKISFHGILPIFNPEESMRVEEAEIVTASADSSLFLIQCIFDACPTLRTLSMKCRTLQSFRPWGVLATSSSTLQSLRLEINHVDHNIVTNYSVRFPALRKLTLISPDISFADPPGAWRDLARPRSALLAEIVQHAPYLSSLNLAGIPTREVVCILKALSNSPRLEELQFGDTIVNVELGAELSKLKIAPQCVKFFGTVLLWRRDQWCAHLASMGSVVGNGKGTDSVRVRFDCPVEISVDAATAS